MEVAIRSAIRPGISTGTSAGATIAQIATLDRLTPGRMTPCELAPYAHMIETEKLNLEWSIQDQIACAYVGQNFIQMYQFPFTTVSLPIVTEEFLLAMEKRLALIYIGMPHQSSEVHEMVIRDLEGNDRDDSRAEGLRKLARRAKDALSVGDFCVLGGIMNENTDLLPQFHPSLVCDRFEIIIAIAKNHDALGCKANGAGGDGGSGTILCGGIASQKRRMIEESASMGAPVIDTKIAPRGVLTWTKE